LFLSFSKLKYGILIAMVGKYKSLNLSIITANMLYAFLRIW